MIPCVSSPPPRGRPEDLAQRDLHLARRLDLLEDHQSALFEDVPQCLAEALIRQFIPGDAAYPRTKRMVVGQETNVEVGHCRSLQWQFRAQRWSKSVRNPLSCRSQMDTCTAMPIASFLPVYELVRNEECD